MTRTGFMWLGMVTSGWTVVKTLTNRLIP